MGMINLKKFAEIDTDALAARMGEGTVLSSFSVLLNSTVAMVFKTHTDDPNEHRINIKIHNRLGIQRQCSFTAVASEVVSVMLDRNVLYAFMLENSGRLSFNRLDPDTKEDLLPLEQGTPVQIIPLSRDDFIIRYKDGTVTRYTDRKTEHLDPAVVSLDRNRNYIFLEGDANGFVRLVDRSELIYTDDNVRHNCEALFSDPVDDCFMIKDTLAVRQGGIITVFKVN